jgi:hypothetical protein
MASGNDGRKRIRADALNVDDVLMKARGMWAQDPLVERSIQMEDRDFWATFGCGTLVIVSLWELLVNNDLLPHGGTLEHLLWTCTFLKVPV